MACSLLLGGCADLAPRYEAPTLAVAAEPDAPTGQAAADLGWREFLTDARLRDTVELALANNRDLRVAALNVQTARAQYRIQDAASLPGVSADASASRSGVAGVVGNNLSVGVGLSAYELDLFGRVKNLSASALQAYLASDESRRSVQISLVAETATAWLTWSADLESQRVAQQTLASRERSLSLEQRRHALGAITGLALSQSQSSVDSARVEVASAAARVARDRHALELLVGAVVPSELAPLGADNQGEVSVLLPLPAGVPSSVLRRRPDVMQAEHLLRASVAEIGVARAALFPRIALTATAGTASSELSGLFKAGSGSWSFGPSLSLPLFDGGAARANVEVARTGRDVALAQYDKAVQTAFKEVRDALSERALLADQMTAQTALLASAERQLSLARAQFRVGRTGMLEVLDAERTLHAAQQSLVSLRLSEQGNRIALYKVLGGGWKEQ